MLQITATDSQGSRALAVGPINVSATNPQTTPQGWLLGLPNPQLVTGSVPITLIDGETLTSGTLLLYPVTTVNGIVNLNPATAITLKSPTVGSGTLATIDTTLYANGPYYILLSATDTFGATKSSGMGIVVGGDYKPGRVTTSVTDLVVPAPGLPISIQRTYDLLQRSSSSDFGNGWSLGVNVQMSVSATYDVTLTLNGQRRTFYFTPYVPGDQVSPGVFAPNLLGVYFPAYTGEPGMYGTLTVGTSGSNLAGSNTGCTLDWLQRDSTSGVFFCYQNAGIYAPGSYVYTDPYGRVYTIGGDGSLKSIRDLGGNMLTVTANGISSTNGLSVPFVRDAQGRITQITDPLLNVYQYGYDASGNLSSVTYPGVATPAAYTYDTTHLYKGGTDPRGSPLPSTQYTDGRLQSVTDGAGQTTSYTYDVPNHSTTVTYPDTGHATLVYDAYGMLLTSTDPLNHTTTNVYDSNHNPASVTDPLGHVTSYTYDANGNRSSVTYPATPTTTNTTNHTTYFNGEPTQTTDELGNSRTFTYDVNSWPKLASDSIGPVVSFTFNTNGTMQSKAVGYDLTTTSGKATTYIYDAYGNLQSETDALSRQTSYTYDKLGRRTSMTPPSGGTTTYVYDALGRMQSMTAPLGRVTTYVYDANGNKTSETDANNHTTSYQYDALNRLTLTTYPTTPPTTMAYTYDFRNNALNTTDQGGHVTHNVYDLAGRLTSMTTAFDTTDASQTSYTYYNDGRKATETDPLGHTTTYNYDAAGRMTSMVDQQNHTTSYVYDDAGNQTSVTDANLHKTQSQYDSRRRLQKTTYDDLTTTQYIYDGPGNLTSVTDQASNVVQYTYDAANQLQSVIQANHPDSTHHATAYGYDSNGNLTAATDANSHTTQSAFDVLNQLKTETMPSGTLTQTRNYDPAGNLLSLTDYNGKTTTYACDALNRLLSKTPDPTLGEPTVSFTYTATGKRASMTDASGTTNYTYDNLDRLKTKVAPQGTLSYTYDTAGNLETMASSNANGISVAHPYDNLNRLSTVVNNHLAAGQNTTTYSYDPANNLATVTYPNGLTSNFTYDSLNRLKLMNGYNYQLGPTGNRTTATEPGGRALSWSYDGIYRLTLETINSASVSYGLDPVGNRLTQNSTLPGVPTASFAYDQNDRILSTESYDPNGNSTASGARTLTYDFENRLKTMTTGGVTVTLQYDGDGSRVAKTVGGVTTRYLVDDLNPTGYAQVVEELVNGTVQRTYTYGLQRIDQNQLINSAWTPVFYGYDGAGSVRTLTDINSTVTDTYDYDAWGNTVNSTGTTPNNYLYRNEQYDRDLGLYYLRARYFNPATGRFLVRDLFGGRATDPITLHKYLYANADPVNRTDPSGRLTNPVSPGQFEVFEGGRRGRTFGEYFTLVLTISTVAAVSVSQIGDQDTCVWEKAADRLLCAALKTAIATNNDFIPDKTTKAGRKNDCILPWKCLIKCYINVDGASYGPYWLLGIGSDEKEDVEAVCLKAERELRQDVNDIPGVAVKHCYRDEGGTRYTWRRLEDAPVWRGQSDKRRPVSPHGK